MSSNSPQNSLPSINIKWLNVVGELRIFLILLFHIETPQREHKIHEIALNYELLCTHKDVPAADEWSGPAMI
jgi:hypothetical protein